jgi:hypothetical protein
MKVNRVGGERAKGQIVGRIFLATLWLLSESGVSQPVLNKMTKVYARMTQ